MQFYLLLLILVRSMTRAMYLVLKLNYHIVCYRHLYKSHYLLLCLANIASKLLFVYSASLYIDHCRDCKFESVFVQEILCVNMCIYIYRCVCVCYRVVWHAERTLIITL